MVGKSTPPTVGELGELLGLLTQYYDHLLYKMQDGAELDDKQDENKSHDITDDEKCEKELLEDAIQNVSNCIWKVAGDLFERLIQY